VKRKGLPVRPVIVVLSIMSIAASVTLAARIGWFLIGSSVHGAALVHRERRAIAARSPQACPGRPAAPPAMTAGPVAGSAPRGLLEVPVLGLVAPVLQGTSDAVLDEAVGHVTGSAWPGQPGTSVLSAHDVTWFSSIGALRPGDVLRYVTPCRTYTYQVTGHHVVTAGSPVYTTAEPKIVLDTCYPFNALYITSKRYLVYASLTSASPTHPLTAPPPGPPAPRVPAPVPLAAEGLGLDHNDAPLGTLTFTGWPTASWRQSSAPLAVHFAALAAYFGVIRSAEQSQRSWWADLAPSVPASAAAPIWGGKLSGYDSALDITLRVEGTQPVSVTLTAVARAGTGSGNAGPYAITVRETVSAGRLLVTGFTMRASSTLGAEHEVFHLRGGSGRPAAVTSEPGGGAR
jgi:sortase A